MSSLPAQRPGRTTLLRLAKMRREGERIAMLTAYDAISAQLLDDMGIDLILVGDSLGNVVLGYDTTVPVTLADMIHHTRAVARATQKALVVFDLPFGTYRDPETALDSAIQALQKTGCQAVKLEGGAVMAPTVKRLTEQGIPVMAHIGLTPQSIHQMGGYFRHGKTEEARARLLADARALEAAGAFAIVLECVVPEVAREVTEALRIPTIGIGSGAGICSGEVLVLNDLIGWNTRPAPSFAKPRANVAELIRDAVASYISEVRTPLELPRISAKPVVEPFQEPTQP